MIVSIHQLKASCDNAVTKLSMRIKINQLLCCGNVMCSHRLAFRGKQLKFRLLRSFILVPKPVSGQEETKEIDGAENSEEPVKFLEMSSVQVVNEPIRLVTDDGDEDRADIVANREGAPEQRGASASHAFGRLIIEELEFSYEHEGFRQSEETMLRN